MALTHAGVLEALGHLWKAPAHLHQTRTHDHMQLLVLPDRRNSLKKQTADVKGVGWPVE